MYGTKEAILYAIEHENEYEKIVFDPYRGVYANDIVNIPHLYYAFYAKLEPSLLQNANLNHTNAEEITVGKYVFRRTNCRWDRYKRGELYIASPWALPEKDIPEDKVLKQINLVSGELAYKIVAPWEVFNPNGK